MRRTYAASLMALLLLQHVQVFMCRPLASSKRLAPDGQDDVALDGDANGEAGAKRTINSGAGQAEELLHQGDQMDSNYDEYPMVVPKRAALLLDRLMVALHRALDKENGRRVVDLYKNKNDLVPPARDDELDLEQGSNYNNMYSDDDPSVIMDYDFKDLNSIHRATGQTLMPKSFQRRRAVGFGVGDELAGGVALLAPASVADASVVGGRGGGGGGGGRSNAGSGRTYWRCYFNAVSCF